MASTLFGDVKNLVDVKGSEVAVSSLEGKVIGIYFSAHWCPPCRGFTPNLVKWVEDFKAGPNGSKLELVFVSSDRDEKSFTEYHHSMNFLALPFDAEETKDALSSKFKVQGIPTLVFVDASGELITKNGREIVTSDPKGEKFPWAPKPLPEIIGNTFINNEGKTFTMDDLKGKYLGIYFSAHWCPPCRGFTPVLSETYKKLKAAGKPFEIIFASSDEDQAAFDEYFHEMPWLAIPFADRDRKKDLSSHFEVSGIPTFVILDPSLQVVTKSGRGVVDSDPEGLEFPWYPKPLNALNESSVDDLNEYPCLIAFSHGDAALEAQLIAALEPVATEFKGKGLSFLYTQAKQDDLVDRVEQFLSITQEGSAPTVLITDLSKQKVSFDRHQPVSAHSIKAFVEAFLANKVEFTSLK